MTDKLRITIDMEMDVGEYGYNNQRLLDKLRFVILEYATNYKLTQERRDE